MTILKRILQLLLGTREYRDPKTMSPTERVAYQQGFEGASKSDNPYPRDSDLWKIWNQGFEDEIDSESSRL